MKSVHRLLAGENNWRQIYKQTTPRPWNVAHDFLRLKVQEQIENQIRDQVWDQVWDHVWDQVREQVWNQVRDNQNEISS